MTASAIIGIVALVVMLVSIVSIAGVFSQALQRIVASHARERELHAQQTSQLLDRFQAIRWEDLAALRATEEPDQDGGFFPPHDDEVGETRVESPGGWGTLSRFSRGSSGLSDEEAALLDEDFPEGAVGT